MKVAIIQESLDAARGGAETSTREMSEALAALGADVTVICAAERDGEARDSGSGLRLLGVAARGITRAGRWANYLERAAERAGRGEFEIVHAVVPVRGAHVYQPRGGTYLETIARSVALGRTGFSRWLRAVGRRFNFKQQLLLRAERELLLGSAPPKIAAVSGYVRRQVLQGYAGFPAEDVRVVFNGVAFAPLDAVASAAARSELRDEWRIEDDRPTLLFVAHNFPLKGLKCAIDALAVPALQSMRPMLIVAGRDNPRPYESLAARRGVGESVRFIGAKTAVGRLYAAADVLVHPTHYDPCSRVVLEALIAGVPVVTTACNGAAEAVQLGAQGFVISDANDVQSLANAISQALAPEVARSSRQLAPGSAAQLSMARHARELLALYEQVRGR